MIELLVTIVVLGVLLAVGLPSLRDFLVGNRLSSNVNGFIGLVNYARSEAIVRNQDVVVCPKNASTIACASTWNTLEIQAFVDLDGNGEHDATDVLLKTMAAVDPTDAETGFERLCRGHLDLRQRRIRPHSPVFQDLRQIVGFRLPGPLWPNGLHQQGRPRSRGGLHRDELPRLLGMWTWP